MPGFIGPQLATLKMKAPSGAQWIHEVKYDGYRIQLHIDGDTRKAFTRNGHNWVNRFSVIAGAFNIEGQAIVDGEVVVIHQGRTNFSELQADLGRGDQDRLVYFAFDLLWLDGKDLRRMAQLARKELLKEFIEANEVERPILYSEHHEGDGQALFEAASKLNYEGIVSKRVDAPYRSERVEAWQKIKTVHREKIPCCWFRQGPVRRRRALPRQAGGQRAAVYGEGRHGLEPDEVGGDPQGPGYRRQPKAEAHKAHQEAEGHVGRSEVLRRHRMPRHHLGRPAAG
jgi:bifunctional non-homologous end joining protein LigD